MRADRLVAILMLLQKNGRTTAVSLARELEVSVRTIYRDVDALSASGVPIYAQRGPGGGIALLDSYRTDLTGMTTAEQEALLMLSVPAPLFDVGVGGDLRSALRKLAAAVPGIQQERGHKMQEKIYIDNSEWAGSGFAGDLLAAIRRALWEDCEVAVSYYSEIGSFAGAMSALFQPLGLVASAGEWYLVARRDQYSVSFPVERILSVTPTGRYFERPKEFRLDEFWQSRKRLIRRQRPALLVEALVRKSALPALEKYLYAIDDDVEDGGLRARAVLRFESFEEARTRILGLGNALEVISPIPLRLSVKDFAFQIISQY